MGCQWAHPMLGARGRMEKETFASHGGRYKKRRDKSIEVSRIESRREWWVLSDAIKRPLRRDLKIDVGCSHQQSLKKPAEHPGLKSHPRRWRRRWEVVRIEGGNLCESVIIIVQGWVPMLGVQHYFHVTRSFSILSPNSGT